jgi:transcriptional regulator with XRE-family HTH domain
VMAEIPEPWATALVEAGCVDPRGTVDRPSLRQLSDRTGIAVTTLTNLVTGRRRTTQDNIDRVAAALGKSPRLVTEWAGRQRTIGTPYAPPADASLLDDRERRAVDEMINLLAREKKHAQKTTAADGAEPETPEPSADKIATGKRRKPRRRAGQSTAAKLRKSGP